MTDGWYFPARMSEREREARAAAGRIVEAMRAGRPPAPKPAGSEEALSAAEERHHWAEEELYARGQDEADGMAADEVFGREP